jgi:hypothetical protein
MAQMSAFVSFFVLEPNPVLIVKRESLFGIVTPHGDIKNQSPAHSQSKKETEQA